MKDNAQTEMELIMNEQQDPVSGNTAPIGAKPSEVRDDITVNVSTNEFVIPAYTLRYFGEDFFNELLGAAEQGWDRIKAGEEPMPPKSVICRDCAGALDMLARSCPAWPRDFIKAEMQQ